MPENIEARRAAMREVNRRTTPQSAKDMGTIRADTDAIAHAYPRLAQAAKSAARRAWEANDDNELAELVLDTTRLRSTIGN